MVLVDMVVGMEADTAVVGTVVVVVLDSIYYQ
jgi:hypothetical protein